MWVSSDYNIAVSMCVHAHAAYCWGQWPRECRYLQREACVHVHAGDRRISGHVSAGAWVARGWHWGCESKYLHVQRMALGMYLYV